jgi:hypothetical protein
VSQYGKPTEFNFGWNIHDFDPDSTSGKRTAVSDPQMYEYSADTEPRLETKATDVLVSDILAHISAITQLAREHDMIQPQQRSNTSSSTTGGRGNTSGGIPYLKIENVNFEKRIARILDVREQDSKFGKQVVVKIAYAAATYLWAINLTNTLLVDLCNFFTQDENKWPGREFYLYLETDDFTNKNRMKVEEVPTKGKK